MNVRHAIGFVAALGLAACSKPTHAQLAAAVQADEVALVAKLLADGADPNGRGEDGTGERPIMIAAKQGNAEVLRLLLAAGADPNPWGEDPLEPAVYGGHLLAVKALLEAGAKVDHVNGTGRVLRTAAARCDPLVIDALLATKPNVNGQDQDCLGWPPLTYAAEQGKLACVKRLAEAGANLDLRNRNGNTALATAVIEGHRDIIRYLLERGANPLVVNRPGWTAASMADQWDKTDIVEMMREHGVTDFAKRPRPELPGGGPKIAVPVIHVEAASR